MTFFSHQSPRSKVLSKKCLWAAVLPQREGNAQTSWEKGKQIFPLHPFLNVTFPPSLQGGCSTRSNAVGAPGRMPRKRCVRATFYSKTSTDWSISTKLCVGAGQGDETDQEKTAQSIESIFLCKVVRWVWKSCPQLEIFSDSELMNLMLSWVCFFLWGFLVSPLHMAQGGNKITLKSRSFVWSQRNFIAEIVLWFSGGKEISRICLWLN